MDPTNQTTLKHVRLKRAQVEAPLARLRLSYLFTSVELRPPGMPPSAVLVVRSMADPLPGRITKDFVSAAMPSAEWQAAAQAQLGAIYRRAARPASGAVPGIAEAVLFADFGELLACLALDFCAGAGDAWWWKSIRRSPSARFAGAAPAAWAEVWSEHPRYVPAALQQLHERGQAARILEKITPAQAWRLLVAVARAYGVPPSAFPAAAAKFPMRSASGPGTHPETPQPRSGALKEAKRSTASGQEDFAARPPWEPYVRASSLPPGLGTERLALLGVSLLLRHDPGQAASAAFAHQLHSWLAQEREREDPIPAPASAIRSTPPSDGNQPSEMRSIVFEESHAAPHSEPAKLISEAAPDFAFEPPARLPEEPFAGFPTTDEPTLAPALHPDAMKRKSRDELPRHFENGCRTGLGGVLYLVHLVLKSGLLEFDMGLRGWALVELLARCLLEPVSADDRNDPIWDGLALLDHRETGTNPETGFQPQDVYEAPRPWLRNLDTEERLVRFRSNRAELWHPEGFLTFDAQQPALDRGSLAQFSRLNRRQRRAWHRNAAVCPIGLTPSPELRRFLHFILPFARWRLGQALRGASLREVLLRKGMLYITPTHVDLVMGMRQISLPARLAGLDANPGWVPELGQVIHFHFEQEGFGYA